MNNNLLYDLSNWINPARLCDKSSSLCSGLFRGKPAGVMQDEMWPLSPPTETKRKRETDMVSFFKWQCVAALHSDRVSLCIYRAACLQTVWLSGCLLHHSLPRIDPPTALLLSALLCCIDVFSDDFHTQRAQIFCAFAHAGFLKTVTQSTLNTCKPLSSLYSIQRGL